MPEIGKLRSTWRELETRLWLPDCGPSRKRWNHHRRLPVRAPGLDTYLRGLGAGNRAWLPSDVGSSHERHDGFTQGREFDCSNYRATWNAPVGWRAQYRALTNLCQPIAPSQRQGSLRSGFACPSMSIKLSRVCIELTCGWRTVDKTAPACIR